MRLLKSKNIKQYIAAALLFAFSFSLGTKVSLAAPIVTPGQQTSGLEGAGGAAGGLSEGTGGGASCDPAKFTLLSVMDSFPTSIISTGLIHSLGALKSIEPWFIAYGASPAETMGCGAYVARLLPSCSLTRGILAQNCPETDPGICKAMVNQFRIGGDRRAGAYDSRAFAESKVAGSLLGYAYLVQNTIKYEPVPVNTAYFFKDYAAKLPIIGDTVYAQNSVDYGHTLINNVLSIWKIFRNIAYAMMSVIMLWVGFAIITRKKISSQTVVNVQYALPKIVIALVMIAFSYPIGATITSLSWTLWSNSRPIIFSISGANPIAGSSLGCGNLTFGQVVNLVEDVGIGGLMILLMKSVVAAGTAGALMLMLPLLTIVLIVYAIFASLKALWIYVKMVISIATSPIQIALYALPGQDDKLEMWLKQMVAWGIGLFGMAMVTWLTMAFALTLVIDSLSFVGNSWVATQPIVSGSLFNIFIVPLLFVFGLATAVKVPTLVEEMIMDKKPGRR